MILVINHKESATLALHMAIMRKPYRNIVKTRYKARRDVLYKYYDDVLHFAKDSLKGQNKTNEMYVDEGHVEMLCEFLKSYTDQLDVLDLKNEMDLEQLQIMKDLYLRCMELLAA